MTTYVGGLRARLVHDSVFAMLRDALATLGWFDASANHSTITFNAEALPPDIEVPLNTMALADEDEQGEDLELGSGLQELRWQMWVDFYAENDTIGLHVIRDVKDILEGRMPSIGRGRPTVDVYDYTLATPVVVFAADIEDVRTDKGRDFAQPWLRYWRACAFTVVDTYDNEDD